MEPGFSVQGEEAYQVSLVERSAFVITERFVSNFAWFLGLFLGRPGERDIYMRLG